jgi:hypothetical protein
MGDGNNRRHRKREQVSLLSFVGALQQGETEHLPLLTAVF